MSSFLLLLFIIIIKDSFKSIKYQNLYPPILIVKGPNLGSFPEVVTKDNRKKAF